MGGECSEGGIEFENDMAEEDEEDEDDDDDEGEDEDEGESEGKGKGEGDDEEDDNEVVLGGGGVVIVSSENVFGFVSGTDAKVTPTGPSIPRPAFTAVASSA